jgi:two-component system cell cycle sensor histidine kinase/response regulator CckA
MNTLEATRDRLAHRGLVLLVLLIPTLALSFVQLGHRPVVLVAFALVSVGTASAWLPWWPQGRRWLLPTVFGVYAVTVGLPFVGFLSGSVAACVLVCTLTTLLFGTRAGFGATAVMALALLVSGWLHSRGVYTLLPGVADLTGAGNWARTGLGLVVLGLLPLQAMLGFVHEISENARSRAVALGELEQEQARHEAAEQVRRQVREEARRAQRQRTIGRLAGGLAHEINGTLQEVEGWLEVLRGALPEGHPSGREALEQMSVSAERATAIGRRLLLLGDAYIPRVERVDLCSFLEGLRGTMAAVLGPDHRLTLEHSGSHACTLDPVELAHALVNLGTNARAAMQGGGGSLAIVLRDPTPAERDASPGAASAIDVTDTGTGMLPEHVSKIFDPFFTTKGAAGTGLGLPSVKRLMEGAGGRVTVRSEVGVGTTFTVLLPGASEAEASRTAFFSPQAEATPPDPRAEGPLVLLVEDEVRIRRVFERLLIRSGLRLDFAADVDEAIACLTRRVPDLVWTDAILPGRPTRELIAEVRRVAPDVPIVVCSGHVAEELLRRDLRAGDLEFVPKPYSAAKLVERARRAARARHASARPSPF